MQCINCLNYIQDKNICVPNAGTQEEFDYYFTINNPYDESKCKFYREKENERIDK